MFRRDLLPPAAAFYANEVRKLSRPSRGWAKALCPFHPDKHPSLSVNLDSGGFLCFSCGAKGGSIIDFVMLRDHVDFRAAAQSLGAWESSTDNRRLRAEVAERRRQRARRDAVAERLVEIERDLRLRYRGEIHQLETLQRQVVEQLAAEGTGRESLLEQSQGLLDRLRERLAAYYLLSFGRVAERVEFLTHPDLRSAAIQCVLGRGCIRDDEGRVFEVVLT